MPLFEWTWNIFFGVVNMNLCFFRVRQQKGNLIRRQWINIKFDIMCM